MRIALAIVLALVACAPLAVFAQARAWLDRDRIEFGQTATLNIESTGLSAPDYAPLLADFDLSGHSSRQQFDWTQSGVRARNAYSVSLRPRRTGSLRIPVLRVGAQRTAALSLLVIAPDPTRRPRVAGRDVFIESEADDQDPYVQQAVGFTVRLYSLPLLVSGRLDQDAPNGASLQRVGDDVQYRRDIDGRSWQVIERRYLLIPERSGELAIPPARFEGRGVGNVFDRIFSDGQTTLSARATPRVLRIRGIPADAPQPWLPLHALTLQYRTPPTAARAGEAVALTIDVLADGAARAQMPVIELPVPGDAKVFAERAQVDEAMVDGRPRTRSVRRFSIVPDRAGPLRIESPSVTWWDVNAGVARRSQLPPITLQVAPGARRVDDDSPVATPTGIPEGGSALDTRVVWALALLSALGVIALMLHRRARRVADDAVVDASIASPILAGPSLTHALAHGDLADIDAALRAFAPGTSNLDALAAALIDDEQRAAVIALRDARWGHGDPAAARALLRRAFARAPRWRETPSPKRESLPPLYPPH